MFHRIWTDSYFSNYLHFLILILEPPLQHYYTNILSKFQPDQYCERYIFQYLHSFAYLIQTSEEFLTDYKKLVLGFSQLKFSPT